jgi:hypothetical protein
MCIVHFWGIRWYHDIAVLDRIYRDISLIRSSSRCNVDVDMIHSHGQDQLDAEQSASAAIFDKLLWKS